ncbi:MAG: LysM peptidoglycan-binding domain-containing protein [Anaerolineales bacterium]|nr:LysM peptidoglycan-binding domain-containing protein [Anaerolineales bacterium]
MSTSAARCSVCGTELQSSSGRQTGRRRSSQVTLSLPIALTLLALFALISAGLTFVAVRFLGVGEPAEPIYTETSTPTTTPTLAPTPTYTPIPSPTPLPPIEHTVSANETCLGLAVFYNVSLQSIVNANPGLTTDCILSVGQIVLVPQPTPTPAPEPTITLPPAEATIAACDTITYTVEADDTLLGIATNYNVDMQAILDYNNKNSEIVFVGEILIIPLCERLPTPGPTPTATPPPPYPAPNLLLPQDGSAFTLANNTVTLQWAAVGELRENEFYRVTVLDITEGSGTVRLVDVVGDTKYIVPVSFRPADPVPHVMRWWIEVVRQTGTNEDGDPIYVVGGDSSIRRDFTWSGAALQPTPMP